MKLIGISGKQFSGKDLLADWLLQQLNSPMLGDVFPSEQGFYKAPIAQAIKQQLAQQLGISLQQIEAQKAFYRPQLIALGNWGRSQDPDYWLKQVLSQPGSKIISDLRLTREVTLLRQYDSFLIRIEADRETRQQRGRLVSEEDPTECELDGRQDWDIVLVNNADEPQALYHQAAQHLLPALQHWLRQNEPLPN